MVERVSDNARRYPREMVPGNLRATIKDENGHEQEAAVADISVGGAGLVVDGLFGNSAFVELHMDGVGTIPGRVARQFAQGIGVEFDISEKEREAMKEELLAFRKAVSSETY
ncbi:MAG: PilZ domain-containing protein [Alphaproteobacteria bacterium]|nr:PilZ domain-containing protein [Alphaproteobacteria bacterium]MBT7943993.1 PilZ domain-containing protein [Alphaproteobacteria bacterium]